MDIKKAGYHTIMMFGGIDELNKKLRMDKKKLSVKSINEILEQITKGGAK